jgi:hypothetical protein
MAQVSYPGEVEITRKPSAKPRILQRFGFRQSGRVLKPRYAVLFGRCHGNRLFLFIAAREII